MFDSCLIHAPYFDFISGSSEARKQGGSQPSRVLAVMSIEGSVDAATFEVYVSECLVPQLWPGAVVVMDNLPAHEVDIISSLLEAVGARVLYLSAYSPEFNPVEHWWSQRRFSGSSLPQP